MRLSPFRALRPRPDVVREVASVPYDVVSRAEAAELARDNPLSFLHVVRSEIDLPASVGDFDPAVHARARDTLDKLVSEGVLLEETEPILLVYRLSVEGHSQTAVVGCVAVEDYERDVIRKHEKTRPDKEDDRVRHMLALGAHPEGVILAYPDEPAIDEAVAGVAAGPAIYDFSADDGVRHTLWRVADTAGFVEAFGRVPVAYVADGHHRCAAAWRAAREGHAAGPERERFPAALFPAGQLRILAYNRLVKDLGGQGEAKLLERLSGVGKLTPAAAGRVPRPRTFAFYLGGRWHLLEPGPEAAGGADLLESLDVAVLHRLVLEPLLGIGDERTDKRLEFVGGTDAAAHIERRVDAGEAALGIVLYPTSVAEMIAVADAGEVMPPKSTWFDPKLRSGLFIHRFFEDP